MKRLGQLTCTLVLLFNFIGSTNVVAQNAAVAEKRAGSGTSAYDKSTPGFGPIRTEDWFVKTWHDRRAKFGEQKSKQQHALVFLGDSITQGWSDDFRGKFPGLKVANR